MPKAVSPETEIAHAPLDVAARISHFAAIDRARAFLQDLGVDRLKECLVALSDAARAAWVGGQDKAIDAVGTKLLDMYHSLPGASYVEIATGIAEIAPALPEIVRIGLRSDVGWRLSGVSGVDWREEAERLMRLPREGETGNECWDEANAISSAFHTLRPLLEICREINLQLGVE